MFGAEESLCWACTRPGTGGCSWDKSFTPVEGWEAEKREFPGACSHPNFSYHVIKCPLFEKDEGYYKPTGGRYSVVPQNTLIKLVKAGWSGAEIASVYSVKKDSVERRIAALNGGAKK